jgi:hypothetical protein
MLVVFEIDIWKKCTMPILLLRYMTECFITK